MTTILNSKKSTGRSAGSKTRHPGIKAFALAHAVSHQFVSQHSTLLGGTPAGPDMACHEQTRT